MTKKQVEIGRQSVPFLALAAPGNFVALVLDGSEILGCRRRHFGGSVGESRRATQRHCHKSFGRHPTSAASGISETKLPNGGTLPRTPTHTSHCRVERNDYPFLTAPLEIKLSCLRQHSLQLLSSRASPKVSTHFYCTLYTR